MDSQAVSELTDFNEDTLEPKHKLTGRMNMHSVALQTPIKGCKKNASRQLLQLQERIYFKTNKDVGQLINTNFSKNQNHHLRYMKLSTEISYHYSTAPGFRQLFKEVLKSSKTHSSLDLNKVAPLIC